MYSTKIDAIKIHKFIKENLCEECQSVDLRPNENDNPNLKYALIYIKTNEGLEPNYIIFNDEKFCIMTSNKSKNEKLSSLTTEDINKLWSQFLYKTFGPSYMLSKTLSKDACK